MSKERLAKLDGDLKLAGYAKRSRQSNLPGPGQAASQAVSVEVPALSGAYALGPLHAGFKLY